MRYLKEAAIMNEKIAITTAKFDHLAEEAQKLGAYYGINYIARGNKGINKHA